VNPRRPEQQTGVGARDLVTVPRGHLRCGEGRRVEQGRQREASGRGPAPDLTGKFRSVRRADRRDSSPVDVERGRADLSRDRIHEIEVGDDQLGGVGRYRDQKEQAQETAHPDSPFNSSRCQKEPPPAASANRGVPDRGIFD
jgi:hypothetical protein